MISKGKIQSPTYYERDSWKSLENCTLPSH